MKISQLEAILKVVREQYGDVDVEVHGEYEYYSSEDVSVDTKQEPPVARIH